MKKLNKESNRRQFLGKTMGISTILGAGVLGSSSFQTVHASALNNETCVLDDIAALRNASSEMIAIGIVFVKCHTELGDGGHGLFYLELTDSFGSPYADNNGTIIQPNDGDGSFVWLREKTNIIYPEWFGAGRAGDVRLELEQALAALNEYETLYFSKMYEVNGTLKVKTSHVILQGQGGGVKQLGLKRKTLFLEKVTNVEIRNLHLVGLGSPAEQFGKITSHNGVAAIWLTGCNNCRINHNYIENHAGGGIRWEDVKEAIDITNNLIISNNKIEGMGNPFIMAEDNGFDAAIGCVSSADYKQITVSNNDISGHAFGVFCSDFGGGSIFITGNNIHDIPGQHGIYLNPMSNAFISGNYFNNIELIAIKNQTRSSGNFPVNSVCKNLVVKDNYIVSAGYGVNIEGNIAQNKVFKDVLIQGNTISHCTFRGMVFINSKSGIVKENVIKYCGEYGVLGNSCSGIIVDNHIIETEYNGIQVSLSDDLTVERNRLVDSPLNASGVASDSKRAYFGYFYKSNTADNNNPNLSLNHNEFLTKNTESKALIYSFRVGESIDVYANKNDNYTSKSWFIEGTVKRFEMGFSREVDFLAGRHSNPTTPVYGVGRRQLFGTQDPSVANMTDAFDDGDICWNAVPSPGKYIGWVCVIPTSDTNEAVWKPFGLIESE